jgi:hypothetical protein
VSINSALLLSWAVLTITPIVGRKRNAIMKMKKGNHNTRSNADVLFDQLLPVMEELGLIAIEGDKIRFTGKGRAGEPIWGIKDIPLILKAEAMCNALPHYLAGDELRQNED